MKTRDSAARITRIERASQNEETQRYADVIAQVRERMQREVKKRR